MVKLITLFLTCADKKEAHKITNALLGDKLIACARLLNVNSTFLWKGHKESSTEVLLMMESREEKFNEIESRVRDIHSYDTIVLEAVPVVRASKGVKEWVSEVLK